MEVIWLQAGIFGPTVIQNSILNGGHYSLTLGGTQFLAKAFTDKDLFYIELFAEKAVNPYAPELATLEMLKSRAIKRNISESQR